MDDERWEEGMPVLDRQGIGPDRVPDRIPDRIPETAPTPLQRQYINLSAIALVAGAVAITAIETGSPLSSPLVKLCTLVAAPLFVITTADAALRFWRSVAPGGRSIAAGRCSGSPGSGPRSSGSWWRSGRRASS